MLDVKKYKDEQKAVLQQEILEAKERMKALQTTKEENDTDSVRIRGSLEATAKFIAQLERLVRNLDQIPE